MTRGAFPSARFGNRRARVSPENDPCHHSPRRATPFLVPHPPTPTHTHPTGPRLRRPRVLLRGQHHGHLPEHQLHEDRRWRWMPPRVRCHRRRPHSLVIKGPSRALAFPTRLAHPSHTAPKTATSNTRAPRPFLIKDPAHEDRASLRSRGSATHAGPEAHWHSGWQ